MKNDDLFFKPIIFYVFLTDFFYLSYTLIQATQTTISNVCDLQDEYLSELFKATSGGHADHKSLCLKYVAHFEFYIKRNKRATNYIILKDIV